MYKLGFKEAEEPEIKLPTIVGPWREQGNSTKAFPSASLTVLKPVWIIINCEKFVRKWEYQTPNLSPEKPVCGSGSNS